MGEQTKVQTNNDNKTVIKSDRKSKHSKASVGKEKGNLKGKGKDSKPKGKAAAAQKDGPNKGSTDGSIKSKGKGLKGKGRGKCKDEGKQEKRKDPSDGRGPFSHASFLKYHGEKFGQKLWDQAGAEA